MREPGQGHGSQPLQRASLESLGAVDNPRALHSCCLALVFPSEGRERSLAHDVPFDAHCYWW